MMWEFKADTDSEAIECIENWMKCGVMPKHDGWCIYPNPDRPGYYCAEMI